MLESVWGPYKLVALTLDTAIEGVRVFIRLIRSSPSYTISIRSVEPQSIAERQQRSANKLNSIKMHNYCYSIAAGIFFNKTIFNFILTHVVLISILGNI